MQKHCDRSRQSVFASSPIIRTKVSLIHQSGRRKVQPAAPAAWRRAMLRHNRSPVDRPSAAAIVCGCAAHRRLWLEWWRIDYFELAVPFTGSVSRWRIGNPRARSKALRHHRSGTLHGLAGRKCRGVSQWFADQSCRRAPWQIAHRAWLRGRSMCIFRARRNW